MLNDDGSVNRSEFFVERRKCPLTEIRRRKLLELEQYMRIKSEKDIASMSEEECYGRLTMLHEAKEGQCEAEMKRRLKEM